MRSQKKLSENFRRGFKSWCEEVSVRIRREISLTSKEPLNPLVLASHLGVVVWQIREIPGLSNDCLRVLLKDDPDSWSAVTLSVNTQYYIILNSKHPLSRQSNTVTHEIAHIMLDHKPARIDVSEDGLLLNTYDINQEQEADWLAGTILLPRDALFLIKRSFKDMIKASEVFGVSTQLLEYRLNVTGVNNQYKRLKKRQSV